MNEVNRLRMRVPADLLDLHGFSVTLCINICVGY